MCNCSKSWPAMYFYGTTSPPKSTGLQNLGCLRIRRHSSANTARGPARVGFRARDLRDQAYQPLSPYRHKPRRRGQAGTGKSGQPGATQAATPPPLPAAPQQRPSRLPPTAAATPHRRAFFRGGDSAEPGRAATSLPRPRLSTKWRRAPSRAGPTRPQSTRPPTRRRCAHAPRPQRTRPFPAAFRRRMRWGDAARLGACAVLLRPCLPRSPLAGSVAGTAGAHAQPGVLRHVL